MPDELPLSAEDERLLVTELARAAADRTAPEELLLFDETAADYWSDPEEVLDPSRRGEAVGFGVDAALVTPVLLAIATPVVRFLASEIGQAVKESAGPRVSGLLRRLFGLEPAETAQSLPAFSGEQISRMRSIALEKGLALGLPAERAGLLADAVVGGALAQS
jgi:hypothetical protein